MKTILLCIALLAEISNLQAQTGFTNYSFSTGWSTSNSKLIDFSIEGAGNKKIHAGLLIETIFYNNNPSKFSIASSVPAL